MLSICLIFLFLLFLPSFEIRYFYILFSLYCLINCTLFYFILDFILKITKLILTYSNLNFTLTTFRVKQSLKTLIPFILLLPSVLTLHVKIMYETHSIVCVCTHKIPTRCVLLNSQYSFRFIHVFTLSDALYLFLHCTSFLGTIFLLSKELPLEFIWCHCASDKWSHY